MNLKGTKNRQNRKGAFAGTSRERPKEWQRLKRFEASWDAEQAVDRKKRCNPALIAMRLMRDSSRS